MTKLASKLEDYKAPWEVDSTGADVPADEQNLDATQLKKYLFALLSDKARLQNTVATVTGERDSLKTELDTKAREGEGAEQKSKREAQEAIDAATKAGDLKALKLEVALDVEGITPAQAKRLANRLTGQTQEELEADAASLVEDFGIGKTQEPDPDDTEETTQVTAARRPRRAQAAGDPAPLTDSKLPDPSDTVSLEKAFPRSR